MRVLRFRLSSLSATNNSRLPALKINSAPRSPLLAAINPHRVTGLPFHGRGFQSLACATNGGCGGGGGRASPAKETQDAPSSTRADKIMCPLKNLCTKAPIDVTTILLINRLSFEQQSSVICAEKRSHFVTVCSSNAPMLC